MSTTIDCERTCLLCGEVLNAPTKNELTTLISKHLEWSCKIANMMAEWSRNGGLEDMIEVFKDDELLERFKMLARTYTLETIEGALSQLDRENWG